MQPVSIVTLHSHNLHAWLSLVASGIALILAPTCLAQEVAYQIKGIISYEGEIKAKWAKHAGFALAANY
jgi:hypothetical protein